MRIDLLDFFEQACLNTQPGDLVQAPSSGVEHWLHADALALRLGFLAISPGCWRQSRRVDSPVIRWVRRHDFAEWQSLFEACFGSVMSESQWTWKYRDTQTPGVAVCQNGRMIAFYGGMPRRVFWGGRRHAGIQVGDVMVHPDFRNGLSRQGPLQMATSTFLEQSLSVNAPYWIGFGFPNQRAMLVARRLNLYRPADQLVELFWLTQFAELPWWLTYATADTNNLEFVDSLWRDMASALPDSLLGARDAQHVQMRYVAHPSHDHILLKVYNKFLRQVYGLAVMRKLSDGRMELLDVVGHPDHFSKLTLACQVFARKNLTATVSAWITQSHMHLLKTAEARVESLDITIPTNDWVQGNLDFEPSGHWWLMSGDTDFR